MRGNMIQRIVNLQSGSKGSMLNDGAGVGGGQVHKECFQNTLSIFLLSHETLDGRQDPKQDFSTRPSPTLHPHTCPCLSPKTL